MVAVGSARCGARIRAGPLLCCSWCGVHAQRALEMGMRSLGLSLPATNPLGGFVFDCLGCTKSSPSFTTRGVALRRRAGGGVPVRGGLILRRRRLSLRRIYECGEFRAHAGQKRLGVERVRMRGTEDPPSPLDHVLRDGLGFEQVVACVEIQSGSRRRALRIDV